MQPAGNHESVSDFLKTQFTLESHRLTLPYSFPSRALIKAPGWNTAYLPDVLVLDKLALVNEPRWQREATITVTAHRNRVRLLRMVYSSWHAPESTAGS